MEPSATNDSGLAGPVQHSPFHPRSLHGTGQPLDAGHLPGYRIDFGLGVRGFGAYDSLAVPRARAVSIADLLKIVGCLDHNVRNLVFRHCGDAGEPWDSVMWHAYLNSGDPGNNSQLCMVRVPVAIELLQNYRTNRRAKGGLKLRKMRKLIVELRALAAEVSHTFAGYNSALILGVFMTTYLHVRWRHALQFSACLCSFPLFWLPPPFQSL